MSEKNLQRAASKIASQKAIEKNATAFESYDYYRKVIDLIERANVATGKKRYFKSSVGSTINFEINRNGISSTRA